MPTWLCIIIRIPLVPGGLACLRQAFWRPSSRAPTPSVPRCLTTQAVSFKSPDHTPAAGGRCVLTPQRLRRVGMCVCARRATTWTSPRWGKGHSLLTPLSLCHSCAGAHRGRAARGNSRLSHHHRLQRRCRRRGRSHRPPLPHDWLWICCSAVQVRAPLPRERAFPLSRCEGDIVFYSCAGEAGPRGCTRKKCWLLCLRFAWAWCGEEAWL